MLHNGSCVNFCPDGTFTHVQDSVLICAKCDFTCLTCAGNATACTSCTSEYKHVPGRCVKKCGEGKYVDAEGLCHSCHPSCKNCNEGGASACTECAAKDNQRLFLHKGECKASCPSGFFEEVASQECKPCDSTCDSCTGPSPSQCMSCSQGLFRIGAPTGSCKPTCPEGKKFDVLELELDV